MKFIILFLAFSAVVCGDNWNYAKEGPNNWKVKFAACNGQEQSPINIKTKNVDFRNLGPIALHNYDQLLNWNFTNSGKTITADKNFDLKDSEAPSISGSSFNETFYLQQFHFHWGKNSKKGSEHLINMQSYPLEIHFVHKSNSGVFAVLGFLFEEIDVENQNLEDLLTFVDNTKLVNSYYEGNLNIRDFIPSASLLNKIGFYRYRGSLTTPPCTEGIIWTLFRSKIPISKNQLNLFYDNQIDKNNRNVQEINQREVHFYRQRKSQG